MEQLNDNIQNEIENEIDIFDFLKFLLRKIKIIIATGFMGVLIAAVYVFLIATPIYEATAQLYVVNSQDSVVNLSDLQIGSYLTSDYQLVFSTWEVNQQVIENLSLPYTIKELTSMLNVTNPSDTRALCITVASPNPKEAAAIANEYAEVASQYISDTMLTDMPTMLSVALEPLEPASPKKAMTMAIGLIAALFVSVFVLFIVYYRDDKIKTSADMLKYTGALPLAVIPMVEKGKDRSIKGRY